MSDTHVVVGAGPVGQATARLLAETGHDVVLASRSGRGSEQAGVRRTAVDAADAEALTGLATGAAAIYNCVNPPSYRVWPGWWPPVAQAFLSAAERSGAVLVTASCLYAYGPVTGPMTEDLPDAATGTKGRIRADMWAAARAAHGSGRLRAVEVRGSDYMGPGVETAHVAQVAARALAGKPVRMFGRVDVPHSFTDVRDMARTLVAVAGRPDAWGRVWHAPTNPARSQADTIADVCRSVGRRPVQVRPWPRAPLGIGGTVVPLLAEMREMAYQFETSYVLDSSAAEWELGLTPTPWDEVCGATALHALGGATVRTSADLA